MTVQREIQETVVVAQSQSHLAIFSFSLNVQSNSTE